MDGLRQVSELTLWLMRASILFSVVVCIGGGVLLMNWIGGDECKAIVENMGEAADGNREKIKQRRKGERIF